MKRLLTSFMVGLAGFQGVISATESRPRLVVGIMVDELRTDYLENLRDMLGAGGFRRLMEQGVFLKDVEFNVDPGDATSAAAIIQTGTYPRNNGVTAARIYDQNSKSLKPVFNDEAFIGNFTSETYSPATLRVNTLTDQITLETGGKAQIHSIAPNSGEAIVLAGHTGNSAFWINDETGRWSTTTYYPAPPAPLQNRNYNNPLVARLDTMKWVPFRPGVIYPFVTAQTAKEGFKYNFSRSDKDVYNIYKASPFVNSDISSGAIEYITSLNLGKDPESTDVLNLAFSLAPSPLADPENNRYEIQDAYLRLDKDLENIFKTLDSHVGRENVLVYLVSTGYVSNPPVDQQKYRLPGGSFSVKRAISLLNSYLSAKYGNGAYIDQYAAGNFYLSKPLLEEKNLELNKVAEDARDFLVRMSGVEDAFTAADLISPSIQQLEYLRHSIDPKTAGDILLIFNPGWKIIDDSRYPTKLEINKTALLDTPGFILAPGINPQVIDIPVEATAIAPTVAGIMRIRPPNSADSKALKLK